METPPPTDVEPVYTEPSDVPFPIPVRRKIDVKVRPHGTNREEELLQLLGTDYEFLKENGDLDLFYVDRAKSKDALLHILTGDSFNRQPMGYHSHAASTILQLSSIEKPTFREEPKIPPKDNMTPYRAVSTINGLEKRESIRAPAQGNPFFPDGLDPTSIVRYISYAYKHRDISKDEVITNSKGQGQGRIRGHCLVPCGADDSDMMNIEMVFNDSGKIISAYPTSVQESSS